MILDFKQEFFRKLIHFSSLWIPILYLNQTTAFMLKILFPLTVFALLIEILRRFWNGFNNFILSIIGKVMRAEEGASLTGATYLYASSTLTIAFFNKEAAIFSLTCLVVCDSLSALIGKKFGKIAMLGKTLEGSLAFLLSGIAIFYFYAKYYYFDITLNSAIMALIAATLVELFSNKIRINDNFTIPLVMCLFLIKDF